MKYDRFMTNVSKERQHSQIRAASKLYALAPHDTIFMAGGMPNEGTFPFSRISIELRNSPEVITLEGKVLDSALQYMGSTGHVPLLEKLKDLQTRMHNLSPNFWESHDILVTSGSMEGLCRTIEMCVEEGDPVIFQEPSYSGVMEAVRPYKPLIVRAVQDECGICPKKLRAALEAQGFTPENVRSQNKGVPKFIYLNPTGANPTGTNLPTDRKIEIYKLACEYDLIILEDDPYFLLHFEQDSPKSFLSMDTEGRVMRFDSFSKILSAGMRLGYVTGPRALIERIELHLTVSTMHTSSLSQVLADGLLATWSKKGFEQHISSIKKFYMKQRDAALVAAEKYLQGLADWSVPGGGLFLWINIHGVRDVTGMIRERSLARGVVVVAGNTFMMDDKQPCNYVRVSYATANPHQLEEGFQRFAKMIRDELMEQDRRDFMLKTVQNGTQNGTKKITA